MNLYSGIHDIITTVSGDSVDIVRIISLIGFLTYLGLAIYTVVVKGQPFDYVSFGAGLGAVITATGVGIKMNPDNKMPPSQNTGS